MPQYASSDSLFDIINGSENSGYNSTDTLTETEATEQDENSNFYRINLPSNYWFVRIAHKIGKWLAPTKTERLTYWDLQFERSRAISYDQWATCSKRMDHILGLDSWKLDQSTTQSNMLYDYKLLVQLTTKMKLLRESNNFAELLYLIRTTWIRNFANINNINLYTHCNLGTKKTIENYITESQLCIDTLLNQDTLDKSYLLSILRQTKRNIGKTALVLSGGATFGLFHIGVIAVLFEANLIPKIISGTSAGAIVASIFCVHTKSEIPNLLANVLNMEFNIFKDNKSTSEDTLIKLSRLLKGGHWFENKYLKATMIEFLGDLTFREAYYRTGKILNITVSPASNFKQQGLLNNLTAPNVLIWSAVCASCSVPGVFPATPLFEKDSKTGETKIWLGNNFNDTKFVDGSVDNDLPISRLSEMFNIDHIIACQVNPHVFPLLKNSLSCVGGQVQNEWSSSLRTKLAYCYSAMNNEILHYLDILTEVGLAPNVMNKLYSVLSQNYSGDITILPDLSMLSQSYELLRNPTREFLLLETMLGARATWPKLSMIRTTCSQEFMLDHAIATLRSQLLMSSDSIKSLSVTAGEKYNLIKLTLNENVEEANTTNKQLLDENIMETETIEPLQMFVAPNDSSNSSNGRIRSYSVRSNLRNPLDTENVNYPTLQATKYRKRSETVSVMKNNFDNFPISPKSSPGKRQPQPRQKCVEPENKDRPSVDDIFQNEMHSNPSKPKNKEKNN